MQSFKRLLLTGVLLGACCGASSAADLNLEAKLVWGTNDDTDNLKHKAVNSELADNLHRMFKWKNYVEITNRVEMIPLNKSADFKMSERCTLKIKNLGNSRVEVNCIGQGKQVSKGVHTLPSKWLVLGGNDQNNTAWFIGLRSVPPNLAAAKAKN